MKGAREKIALCPSQLPFQPCRTSCVKMEGQSNEKQDSSIADQADKVALTANGSATATGEAEVDIPAEDPQPPVKETEQRDSSATSSIPSMPIDSATDADSSNKEAIQTTAPISAESANSKSKDVPTSSPPQLTLPDKVGAVSPGGNPIILGIAVVDFVSSSRATTWRNVGKDWESSPAGRGSFRKPASLSDTLDRILFLSDSYQNHLVGPQVEYAHPKELAEDEELCSNLPFMALPDGSHLVSQLGDCLLNGNARLSD